MKKIWFICLSIIFTILISGCASNPTSLELVIKSKSNINIDSDNMPSPLMLNYYELDSAEQFSKLDYWTLLDKTKEKLNSDLISQSKHIIVPNEEQTHKILFDDRAKFLGIVGNFRNLDSKNVWRYVINLDQNSHNSVELEIDGYTIKEAE